MNIKFFASLKDRLGCDELVWHEAQNIKTVEAVIAKLVAENPTWSDAFGSGKLLMAVNQEMANLTTPVAASDEVAFFPPVTGG